MPRPKQYETPAEKQRAYRQRKGTAIRNASALRTDKSLIKLDRPALQYFGGKWVLKDWIVSQFPPHTTYVEPFAGGASVLLSKPPTSVEVLNDLNHTLINFFDVLRDEPEKLIRAIWLTPYSREEFKRSGAPADNRVENARRFYVRCQQARGSGTVSHAGWRFAVGKPGDVRNPAVNAWSEIDHLWSVAQRLKMVQIECDDAYKVIERYDRPSTLFYLDYPYVHSIRSNNHLHAYEFEMTDDDHRKFAELMYRIQGMAIVSGYPSPLYDELYAGWKCISRGTNDIDHSPQTECLWLSPRTVELANLPLFSQA
jgi:DNA adenine methylase